MTLCDSTCLGKFELFTTEMMKIFKNPLFRVTALLSFLFFTVCNTSSALAQTEYDTSKMYLVTKNDGTQYTGKILKSDEREILLNSTSIGKIFIPKHEIKAIKEINAADVNGKGYIGEDDFATRHILTPNGHALGKGNNYAQLNLWGPDVEFGVGKKFTVGIMTSWLAIPLVGTAKYSFEITPKLHLGTGLLAGTLSWANPSGFGFLPYGALTLGDRKNNVTFTGGYLTVGASGNSASQPLFSIGALARLSNKVTFVFDSFIVPPAGEDVLNIGTVAIFVPGLRFSGNPGKSFQFGFAGVSAGDQLIPFPFPVVSWLRAF